MEAEQTEIMAEFEQIKTHFTEFPDQHPNYADEHKDFLKRKTWTVPDTDKRDFFPEWKEHWPTRLEALLRVTLNTKLEALKAKYAPTLYTSPTPTPTPTTHPAPAVVVPVQAVTPSISATIGHSIPPPATPSAVPQGQPHLNNHDKDFQTESSASDSNSRDFSSTQQNLQPKIQQRMAHLPATEKVRFAEALSDRLMIDGRTQISQEDLLIFVSDSIDSFLRTCFEDFARRSRSPPNPNDAAQAQAQTNGQGGARSLGQKAWEESFSRTRSILGYAEPTTSEVAKTLNPCHCQSQGISHSHSHPLSTSASTIIANNANPKTVILRRPHDPDALCYKCRQLGHVAVGCSNKRINFRKLKKMQPMPIQLRNKKILTSPILD